MRKDKLNEKKGKQMENGRTNERKKNKWVLLNIEHTENEAWIICETIWKAWRCYFISFMKRKETAAAVAAAQEMQKVKQENGEKKTENREIGLQRREKVASLNKRNLVFFLMTKVTELWK